MGGCGCGVWVGGHVYAHGHTTQCTSFTSLTGTLELAKRSMLYCARRATIVAGGKKAFDKNPVGIEPGHMCVTKLTTRPR